MATTKTGANGTSTKSTAELKKWYEENHKNIENFAKAQDSIHTLRDVTQTYTRSISTIDKEKLKTYIENIGSNEKNLRNTARYLYYRSNILYRIVNWYASMWCLNARQVTPKIDLKSDNVDAASIKSNYIDTLDVLDKMNLQGNLTEALINVYIQDVYYGIRYMDDTGMFLYTLDPDDCIIDSRYSTMDFGCAVNMANWKTKQKQQIIEYLGSPLKEMYAEYERTGVKYQHLSDEYAVVLKYRTDIYDTAIPPLLTILLQVASLEDLVDIQAEAEKLDIYKLVYLPLKTNSNSNSVDDFQIDPALAKKYFNVLLNNAIPSSVAGAMIPGDELKVIDFSKSVDSDTTSVEKASNQVLQTAGGGAVINSNNITSTAAFEAWLEAETQFAISTLLPQIDGITNRILSYELGDKAANVKHFEVSCYTKNKLAEQMLTSCQYGYSNKLAYNTLLGISEKQTLKQQILEEEILELHNIMRYPLTSSFTTSNDESSTEDGYTTEVGQGAPTKDSGDLSNSGDADRNR